LSGRSWEKEVVGGSTTQIRLTSIALGMRVSVAVVSNILVTTSSEFSPSTEYWSLGGNTCKTSTPFEAAFATLLGDIRIYTQL